MQVPPGKKSPLPYVASLLPPTLLALSYPDVFFKALDYAGTYGVLLLFGLVPAAMAWSERWALSYMSKQAYRFHAAELGYRLLFNQIQITSKPSIQLEKPSEICLMPEMSYQPEQADI